MQMMEMLQSMM